MPKNMRKRLRDLLASGEIVVGPIAYDGFSARLIEDAGFSALCVGGSAINAAIGIPDGEATRTEFLGRVREIVDAVDIPVRVDIETGFGSGTALDLMRTVKECERIGVASVMCEDQVTAVKNQTVVVKRTEFNQAYLIPIDEMVRKIQAALEARDDPDFHFTARTDAWSIYGFDEMIKRAKAYAAAGADMISLQSIASVDELKKAVDLIPAPIMLSSLCALKMSLTFADLQAIGIKMVHAGGAQQAAGRAMQNFLQEYKTTGTFKGFLPFMMTKEEVCETVKTSERDALRKRYVTVSDLR